MSDAPPLTLNDDAEQAVAPRPAASVILARPRADEGVPEYYLVRRNRAATFMSSAFVFPGGAVDAHEAADHRLAAARELFEEAGVLLSNTAAPAQTAALRARMLAGECTFNDVLEQLGVGLDLDALTYFAHWITPSIERKRFSATFFVTQLPAGQSPSPDNAETVEEAWVTADEALDRAGELRLPPPQVRTFFELSGLGSLKALGALSKKRALSPHPILPRMHPLASGFALLLPWDPDYANATGDELPIDANHPVAFGPSRFIYRDNTWMHLDAPNSAP